MPKLSKNEWVAVAVAIVIVVLFFGYNYLTGFFNQFSNVNIQSNEENASTSPEGGIPTNLSIQDETVGTGDVAAVGDQVTVNYIGTFPDGTKFDSSYDRGQPISFTLGAGQVIPGWDLGIVGMKVGGKRKLVIPPDLGYGANDYGPIPGNSTLVFEVELVGVTHSKTSSQ